MRQLEAVPFFTRRNEFAPMMSDHQTATGLLNRLLARERGALPMHLAMLLERSSALRNNDEHYRKILPIELAEVRLTPTAAQEIITALCSEISRNPDAGLVAAVSKKIKFGEIQRQTPKTPPNFLLGWPD